MPKQTGNARRLNAQLSHVPVASLMFAVVESRLDVLIFRACLAPSVYRARQMVIHGKVKVDGDKVIDPNKRLQPGQMFQVDPRAIDMLRMHQSQPQGLPSKSEKKPVPDHATKKAEETAEEAGEASADANTAGSAESESLEAAEEAEAPPAKRHFPFDLQPAPKSLKENLPFRLPDYAAPFLFVPPYLEVNFPTCSAVFVRRPTAGPNYSEIPTPYEADGEVMRMAWEWYNQVGPRQRGKRRAGNDFKRQKRDESHIYKESL